MQYIKTSALFGENVKNVFDAVLLKFAGEDDPGDDPNQPIYTSDEEIPIEEESACVPCLKCQTF